MKDRSEKFDIARGIGILLITLGHCKVPVELNHYIYAFHVPLFFVIAGGVFNEQKYCDKSRSMQSIALSKARSYLIPYAVMYSVNVLLISFSWKGLNIFGFGANILMHIRHMLESTDYFPHCEPLWFLPCMYLANVLFILLMRIKQRKAVYIAGVPSLACLFYLKRYLSPSILFWHAEIALLGASFMIIGHQLEKFLKRDQLSDKEKSLFLCFCALGGILAAYFNKDGADLNHLKTGSIVLFYFHSILLSLSCIQVSSILAKVRIKKLFVYVGRNSLPVMGFNYQCISLARRVLTPIENTSFYWVMEFLLSSVLLLGVVQLWNYCKQVLYYKNQLLLSRKEKV